MAKGLRSTAALLLAILLAGTAVTISRADSGGSVSSPGQEAQLLADGAYYPALLGKIKEARKSIDLVMYLWKISPGIDSKPGGLVRALGEARRRGVSVRVVMENSGYDEGMNLTNRETAEMLQREGITAVFDSPSVTTHTKLVVIDHRFCFIGSHNLTQSALGRNHEMSILLDNPRLAGELGTYVDKLLGKR